MARQGCNSSAVVVSWHVQKPVKGATSVRVDEQSMTAHTHSLELRKLGQEDYCEFKASPNNRANEGRRTSGFCPIMQHYSVEPVPVPRGSCTPALHIRRDQVQKCVLPMGTLESSTIIIQSNLGTILLPEISSEEKI